MQKLSHLAIYRQSDADKNWLIAAITNGDLLGNEFDLNSLQGELYSNITLQHFIDEELRHDHFEIDTGTGNALSTSSSGERRKALLNHIIAKKPGFIILDNVFESLDIQARKTILFQLQKVAEDVILIQLLDRKKDLLPFIETVYILEQTTIVKKLHRHQFQRETPCTFPSFLIGPSLHHYKISRPFKIL